MTSEMAFFGPRDSGRRGRVLRLFVLSRSVALPGAAESVKSKAQGTVWKRYLATVNKRNGAGGRQQSDDYFLSLPVVSTSHKMDESSKEDLEGKLS